MRKWITHAIFYGTGTEIIQKGNTTGNAKKESETGTPGKEEQRRGGPGTLERLRWSPTRATTLLAVVDYTVVVFRASASFLDSIIYNTAMVMVVVYLSYLAIFMVVVRRG